MTELQTPDESEILSRVIAPQNGNLPGQVAEVFLGLEFPKHDVDQMNELAEKNRRGVAVSAVVGHVGAIVVPTWFGYRSTNTAGMMAVAAGAIYLLAALLAPRHGVCVRMVRHRVLAWGILAQDVLALLYRIEERGAETKRSRRTDSR